MFRFVFWDGKHGEAVVLSVSWLLGGSVIHLCHYRKSRAFTSKRQEARQDGMTFASALLGVRTRVNEKKVL